MQTDFVDLHTHTTASDGTDTPSKLVCKAAHLGLRAIAITDHDTLAGLDEGIKAGKQYHIEVIRGCELGVKTEYGEMHLVGLWIPEDASIMEKRLADLRQKRNSRNQQILQKLNDQGYPLEYADVLRFAHGESAGRPHIAAAMLEKGYIHSRAEAFTKFLDTGGSAFVPREVLTPEEGVSLMANLGATVCIAHPKIMHCPPEWFDSLIPKLKNCGLAGLEMYHSDHSLEDEKFCLDLARRYNLAISGGSDYHGKAKPSVHLGRCKGSGFIPGTVLDNLKALRKAAGLPDR